MWNKPSRLQEGFLVGGGLLALGVLLQVTIGPMDRDLFASPVNYGMLALLLALIGRCTCFAGKSMPSNG